MALLLALPGASCVSQIPGQAGVIEPKLAAACQEAMALVSIASAIPQAAAIIPFITVGCATADGIAKLAADPSSTAWVGTLIGQIQALAGRAGVKLPA